MPFFLASVAALAVGPLLDWATSGRRGWVPAIDGLVAAAVPGLVFLEFVPRAVAQGDWAVLAALATGFLLPAAVKRATRGGHAETSDRRATVHRWALLAGGAGLLVHAAFEGAAVATLSDGAAAAPLGSAIVLHRVPIGIAVWWLVSRETNRRAGALALASVAVATWVGFGLLSAGGAPHTSTALTLFQAAVGGSLVHVVFHRQGSATTDRDRRLEGWGAVLAVGVLIAFYLAAADPHAESPRAFLSRFYSLAAESAPALLLAYVCAGLVSVFLPERLVTWMRSAGPVSQAGRGVAIGAPLQVCSCGVVPLYRGLVQRGASAAAAVAFLVAAPALSLEAVLLSVPLLGGHVTLLRVAAIGVVALTVGALVGRRLPPNECTEGPRCGPHCDATVRTRLKDAVRTGTGDMVHHTAPWIVLGLAVAALIVPVLESGWLGTLPPVAAVVLFALLGFPACFCAVSSTPLVAAFLATGLSPGAGIAFLVTGPSTNVATLGLVRSMHGRRAAATFAVAMFAFAIAVGLAVNAAFGALTMPSLTDLTEDAPGALHRICLAVIALLFLRSVAQRGVRAFVGTLRSGMRWSPSHTSC